MDEVGEPGTGIVCFIHSCVCPSEPTVAICTDFWSLARTITDQDPVLLVKDGHCQRRLLAG